MANYRYYAGAEGREWCYSTTRSYRCPLDPRSGENDRLESVVEVLDGVGLDGKQMLLSAHQRGRASEGDRCGSCGAKMEPLGYRAWLNTPNPSEVTQRVADRLGFRTAMVQERSRYWPLKREAIEWAREEAKLDREIASEERDVVS